MIIFYNKDTLFLSLILQLTRTDKLLYTSILQLITGMLLVFVAHSIYSASPYSDKILR